jgi:hypothetical protein
LRTVARRVDGGRPLRDAMEAGGHTCRSLAARTREVDPACRGISLQLVSSLASDRTWSRDSCSPASATLIAEALGKPAESLFTIAARPRRPAAAAAAPEPSGGLDPAVPIRSLADLITAVIRRDGYRGLGAMAQAGRIPYKTLYAWRSSTRGAKVGPSIDRLRTFAEDHQLPLALVLHAAGRVARDQQPCVFPCPRVLQNVE